MGSNNQEDIESMLVRVTSLEKSIIALVDKGCIIKEKLTLHEKRHLKETLKSLELCGIKLTLK